MSMSSERRERRPEKRPEKRAEKRPGKRPVKRSERKAEQKSEKRGEERARVSRLDTPQEGWGQVTPSPQQSMEVRMKRKRLSVDFEGMDAEEEMAQVSGEVEALPTVPPASVTQSVP